MARAIGIGKQDFEKIRSGGYFYVDKTDFIRQWWDTGDEVTLITRPRRFGKTLNMSMLEKFFSVDYAGRDDLFAGLAIWEYESYRKLQGTYPVLFISFADVKETSYLQTRKKICNIIRETYDRYRFLTDVELLSESEKRQFWHVSADMEDYEASGSIRALSNYMSRYYGQKVIILLDEYDTPMQEAYALEEYGLSDQSQQVREWYDGFTFGKREDIYNPWSIINFLDDKNVGVYWANSSSNSLTGKLIREGSPGIKMTMERLLRGETFRTTFDEQIVFNQLDQGDDAVWSLFLASGYLKVVHYEYNIVRRRAEYELKLTNLEVQTMFERMIEGWFGACRRVHNAFLQAFLAGDLKAMNVYMNKITTEMFSYFDTAKRRFSN